jgi:hypothetical protein
MISLAKGIERYVLALSGLRFPGGRLPRFWVLFEYYGIGHALGAVKNACPH